MYFHQVKKFFWNYEINWRATTLASRIIGKGCTGLHKFYSIVGLASSVC